MDILTSITNFNWLDYAVIGVVLISTLISLVRGLVREVLSLITWVVAFWVSFQFTHAVGMMLSSYVKTLSVRMAISFVVLFVVVLILGGVVNFLIGEIVDKAGLSSTDRALGTVFGCARGLLLIAVLVIFATVTSFPEADWWKQSVLIPHVKEISMWLQSVLPAKMQASLEAAANKAVSS